MYSRTINTAGPLVLLTLANIVGQSNVGHTPATEAR